MDTNKMRDISRGQFEAWHKRVAAALVAAGEIGAARNMHAFKETMLATWEASRDAVVVDIPTGDQILDTYDPSESNSTFNAEGLREDLADQLKNLGLKVAP